MIVIVVDNYESFHIAAVVISGGGYDLAAGVGNPARLVGG